MSPSCLGFASRDSNVFMFSVVLGVVEKCFCPQKGGKVFDSVNPRDLTARSQKNYIHVFYKELEAEKSSKIKGFLRN